MHTMARTTISLPTLAALAIALLGAGASAQAQPQPPAHAVPARHAPQSVSWDPYSLSVDGKRLVVWSGEFHPFRLPSPPLWRDVLQKMKALGFNTVSFYFDWAYHSPAPGVYDFTGVRDMDRLLSMAEEE